MAMPLTAAASTFYAVHEIYNAKRAKISDERNKAEAGKTGSKDDKGNNIASIGTAIYYVPTMDIANCLLIFSVLFSS